STGNTATPRSTPPKGPPRAASTSRSPIPARLRRPLTAANEHRGEDLWAIDRGGGRCGGRRRSLVFGLFLLSAETASRRRRNGGAHLRDRSCGNHPSGTLRRC